MFKNILVPTDGSDLAAKAVEQAVLFAKEIGAKIAALTVTEPFHLLSVELSQLEYTPIESKTCGGSRRESARYRLGCGQLSRCRLRGASCRARTDLSGNYRRGLGERLRFDRDGLARASRCLGGCPRQRNGQSAHTFDDPRTCISLRGMPIAFQRLAASGL